MLLLSHLLHHCQHPHLLHPRCLIVPLLPLRLPLPSPVVKSRFTNIPPEIVPAELPPPLPPPDVPPPAVPACSALNSAEADALNLPYAVSVVVHLTVYVPASFVSSLLNSCSTPEPKLSETVAPDGFVNKIVLVNPPYNSSLTEHLYFIDPNTSIVLAVVTFSIVIEGVLSTLISNL